MKLIDRAHVESHKEEIIEAIKAGKIFIYPTDTIYGLGCNALLGDVVQKIREIKQRDTKPLLVIAPNKEWIEEHCIARREDLDQYLPGPYSLYLRRKDQAVAPEVNPEDDTLGVRIIDHWFMDLISEAGVPFVTTSVNLSGEERMTRIEDVDPAILDQVDYVVYEGENKGEPSKKISLV